MRQPRSTRSARAPRPLPKLQREILTQTRARDHLVFQAEQIYRAEHRRLIVQAHDLYMEWAQEQPLDAGEEELLRKMRGLFDNPENLKAVFGPIAGFLSSDVIQTVSQTVPDRVTAVSRPPGENAKSRRLLEQFLSRNTLLMNSVGDVVIARIRKALRGDTKHRTIEALEQEFQNAAQATESRVELWARDQTLQLHADLTRAKHEEIGISRYFWTDSNDRRVRRRHGELGEMSDQGFAFEYRKPPVMSEDGRRGNPGDDYQCRCTAFPILD